MKKGKYARTRPSSKQQGKNTIIFFSLGILILLLIVGVVIAIVQHIPQPEPNKDQNIHTQSAGKDSSTALERSAGNSSEQITETIAGASIETAATGYTPVESTKLEKPEESGSVQCESVSSQEPTSTVVETTSKKQPVQEYQSIPDKASAQFDISRLVGKWEYRTVIDGTAYYCYMVFGDGQTVEAALGIEYGEFYQSFSGKYSVLESNSDTKAVLRMDLIGGYIELGAPPENRAVCADVEIRIDNNNLYASKRTGDTFFVFKDYDTYLLKRESSEVSPTNGAVYKSAGEYFSAEYNTEKIYKEYKNAENNTRFAYYYDKVILDESSSENKNINQVICEDAATFFNKVSEKEYTTALESPAQAGNTDMYCGASATVTYNQDGLFSILIDGSQYLGGVPVQFKYGLNFDLNSGKELSLSDILTVGADSFRHKVWECLTDTYGNSLLDDAYQTFYSIDIDDYQFYLKNNQIVIIFRPYLLSPGARGCLTATVDY